MPQKNVSGVTADVKVGDMMQIMDVADALRAQQAGLDRELSHDDQVADIKRRLQATYTEMGRTVDDATLQQAIEAHFSHKYEFQPPKKDFNHTLALAYVNRKRIGLHYGVPALILSGLVLAGWGISSSVEAHRLQQEETAVEESVLSACNLQKKIGSEVTSLATTPSAEQLPSAEKVTLLEAIEGARRSLSLNEDFFHQYCRDNGVADLVTRTNFNDVARLIPPVEASLNNARVGYEKGAQVLSTQEEINGVRRDLDLSLTAVRETKPLEVFLKQAESYYQQGLTSIERRDLSESRSFLTQLQGVGTQARKFATLSDKIDPLYSSITQILDPHETEGKKQAEDLYQQAKKDLENADATHLQNVVGQMQELQHNLSVEYKITIVSRPGEKSGIDKYYDEDMSDGKQGNFSGYYYLVEAVGTDGRAIPQNITSSETGRTRKVTKWGEGMEPRAWQRLVDDKTADGIVDDNVIGKKPKGYLTPKYEPRFQTNGKRMTEWDE